MIVVSNSGPLIHLSSIGQLNLLSDLWGRILVPAEVYREVVVAGEGLPGSREVAAAPWIDHAEISGPPSIVRALDGLGAGEAETIATAVDVGAGLILLDDRQARSVARRLGLTVRGTLGVLLLAKASRLIERVEPHLRALVANGIWLSSAMIDEVLASAGER